MSIYDQLLDEPYVKELKEKYHIVQPLLHKDKSKNENLLTGSTLSSDRMILPNPLIFSLVDEERDNTNEEYNELICIYHLGDKLCGHPGIVHGGLLLTLLDESLCRCAFPLFVKKLGVTASLTINYIKPCYQDQFVVLKARVKQYHHLRKILVEGVIESLSNQLLVQAECLVVEPKNLTL